jgi:hypothetical protein
MTLLTRLFKQAPPAQTPQPVVSEPAPTPASTDADAALLTQAVAANDADALSKLAIEGASTKIRQAAADAIHDPAVLKDLLKDLRGKDKSVYKIVRAKCDALLAQEKAAAETQAAIAHVCEVLERHSHLPFDNLFTPTLEHLNAQWESLASQAPPEMKARAERAIERCRDIVSAHLRKVAQQAAYETALANADANRGVVIDELRAVLAAAFAAKPADLIASQLTALQSRWTEIAQFKAANTQDTKQFERLCHAINDVSAMIAAQGTALQLAEPLRDTVGKHDTGALERLLAHVTLLGDNVPADVADAAALLQAYRQARDEQDAAAAHALKQLGGLIRKALAALNDGQTGPAAGLRRAIEEKRTASAHLPAHLSNQLQTLDEKLALLQDWRSYVVAPKRIELIERMEALIGSDEKPDALAETIKKLQEEWKSISKGNTDNTDAEWQRFHQAAQTAYQPCKEYFAAQAKQRQDNLDKRKALLERLQAFAAAQTWDQPDWQANWKDVARALRESRQQWRTHQPVERAANKPLQAQFDAISADLQAHLDAEYARNAKEKQRLIAAAQRALTLDDGRKASDEIKRLQLAWKDVGLVARDDEQALWEEFRKHCDAVFVKRQQLHNEFKASLDSAKEQALALCTDVERIGALDGAEFVEGLKTLPALRETFAALGDLPKAQARDVQNRFERALAQCDRKLAEQRARDKARAWDNVVLAGDKLRNYRLAALQSSDGADALKAEVQTYIDSVQHWPKGALQALKAELSKSSSADLAANETALRTLCVRAEILTGVPTPESDQAFRRNYQMQLLKQTMGQGQSANKDQLDTMVLEWIAVGPVADDAYAPLLERFNRCRAR